MKKSTSALFLISVFLVDAHDDYAYLLHKTMWADFLFYDKQHNTAQEWYTRIIAETTLPQPLRSYALLLFNTQQFGTLLDYKSMLNAHFSHDVEIQKALALALAHEHHDNEAEATFLALVHKFPTTYEIAIPAAQILMRRGDYKGAQDILEKIVNVRTQKTISSLIMVLLAQNYIKTGNIAGAHALLAQCTTQHAAYAPAWLLLGTVEELQGNQVAALGAYKTFRVLSVLPIPEVDKRIGALSDVSFSSHEQRIHTAKLQIVALVLKQEYARALPLIKECLTTTPDDASLRALYIHGLVATGAAPTALATIVQYITKNPHDHRWWGALHILTLNPMTHARACATLNTIQRQYPHIVWGYLYCGDCDVRAHEYVAAHELYASALTCTHEVPMRAELYFLQALCGYELDDYDRVKQAVTAGLACPCVHAPLCNIAAYYYAHCGDYEKATQLSTLCCSLEPHNYHYQDTALFIAYKKGNYDTVAAAYAKLHAAYPTDATITLHAARSSYRQDKKSASAELLAHARDHAYSQYEQRRIQVRCQCEIS